MICQIGHLISIVKTDMMNEVHQGNRGGQYSQDSAMACKQDDN